jgi:N-acetylglucosaminyldiphosphoundecaprenol N-acetyl-beta-D-mannosaminyltransferase
LESQVAEGRRFSFLDVPVDAVDLEGIHALVPRFARDEGRHHIVLLSLKKLMKARRDAQYYSYVSRASLILPVSRGIVRGAAFQKKPTLHRYNPFEFVIRLLTLAEEKELTVYLLGARRPDLLRVESNLRTSFPTLQIVGRYSGFYGKSEEADVIVAIKKAAPSLLLVGSGVPGGERWITAHAKQLNPGIAIWVENCFEIFAGKAKRPRRELFESGLESLPGILARPWRWLKILPFMYFKFLVIAYRLMGR